MMKGMLRVALAAAVLMAGVDSAKADELPGPGKNTLEVRLINNYAATVRVYVQDAQGRMHALGRVARADFKILEVPKAITDMGAFSIRVYPSEPVWSLAGESDGVRTRGLSLGMGDAVNFWVETDIADSKVELVKS